MKLATLRSVSRDGRLAVVSRDLTRLTAVGDIAATMQLALENWAEVEPKLREVYDGLNRGSCTSEELEVDRLMAPLPRSHFLWDCSAYLRHAQLMGSWVQRPLAASAFIEPMGYAQGAPNNLGPTDDVLLPDGAEVWGIDFEAEVAVITGDVPMMTTEATASGHIRLVTLMNDISLRNLIPRELEKGFGLIYSKPAKAFAPIAVTPDELGEAWDGDKVHLPLISTFRGERFGSPNAGEGCLFGFRSIVAFLAKVRSLPAGAIIGGGTVSNLDRSVGSSCIAERRVLENLDGARELTDWMRFGDRIRIEMTDTAGMSIFGAIDHAMRPMRHAGTVAGGA